MPVNRNGVASSDLAPAKSWFGQDSEWILSRFCLERKLDLTGMLAERLSAPTRPLPHAQLRRIDDEETRFALADLNADVWRPEALGQASASLRRALARIAFWKNSLCRGRACFRRVCASDWQSPLHRMGGHVENPSTVGFRGTGDPRKSRRRRKSNQPPADNPTRNDRWSSCLYKDGIPVRREVPCLRTTIRRNEFAADIVETKNEELVRKIMRIDIHTHFQCLDFVKHLQGRSTMPKSLLDGGNYIIQCAAGLNVPALAKSVDMEEKLRDMDEMKIDVAVLSHGIPFGPDVLDTKEADEWAKRINDNLAGIIDRYPGKFIGFGTIGFGDSQRSIAEVDRCIKKLGFKGIQVFSNISNKLLDSPEFFPVLKHIGMLGVPIHLHPALPLNRVGLETASQFLPLGFPYDTSLNTLRLIQSGLFDETPDLKLIVAHVGGVLPYLIGRIGTYTAPSPLVPKASLLKHTIEHYLHKLYVDTVCYHLEALECCYKTIGPEQMLYGTDHPFGHYDVATGLIERLGCSAPERELIYHGNAERLLNLKQASVGV